MFLVLGVGVTGAALFHVVTHAFFKGLLFLGAGSVIHGMHGEQDMQKMGNLRRYMPITFWTMLVGTLAISGIPPLSGFFSKDEIIWGAFAGPRPQPVLGVIGYVVALLTAVYMGRMLFLTFFGHERFDHHHVHPHESPATMWVPLAVLAALSIGAVRRDPRDRDALHRRRDTPHAPTVMLLLAFARSPSGGSASRYAAVREPSIPERRRRRAGVYAFLATSGVRQLYDAIVVRPLFAAAEAGARFFDPRIVDGAVNGVAALFAATSAAWRRAQTGNLQHYALSVVAGALALLGWYVVR
jgi:NADH-quinone oxidoreductase subunit L